MRLALILCTLSAALCLASAVGQSEAPTKSSANGYPKKVTTLKKRPTKTPSTAATLATTTKPSKPRVKISSKTSAAATTTTTATTKAPALTALVDASFSNLPADDLEFIKELDKQFKLHGNKIKIKVERDNSTSSSSGGGGKSNNKRTIDGELGYGYAHQGYDYTPPKFMFYPYSQHDIPATESPDIYTGYPPAEYEQPRETTQPQQQVTSVTIEPSYSYELKPQTSYESQPQSPDVVHQAEQPQIDLPQPPPQPQQHESTGPSGEDAGAYQEPVIVLRIPGPAKYAAHLQTLLQQYLEIRAAQYLQLLQEAEQRKHQQQQHHLQQQEEHLAPQPYATPEQHEQAHYHPDVSYAHQLAPTPPPVQYGPIDDVYHTYKGRHQQQQQYEQPALPETYYTPSVYQPQPQPQFYYAQPAQQTGAYEHGYQPHVYLIAMAPQDQYEQQHQHQHQHQHLPQPQQQPIYVPEQDAPTAPAAEQATGHELPITENNPRATHTKVIFNGGGGAGGGDYAAPMYELPSIQQQYHEVAAEQQSHQPESAAHVVDAPSPDDYQPVQSSGESIASVTQPPYNYHAHGLKMPRQLRQQGKRAAHAEQAADHQLQQIREYVREKLGAEMGSAVEYKTTQLLEG